MMASAMRVSLGNETHANTLFNALGFSKMAPDRPNVTVLTEMARKTR